MAEFTAIQRKLVPSGQVQSTSHRRAASPSHQLHTIPKPGNQQSLLSRQARPNFNILLGSQVRTPRAGVGYGVALIVKRIGILNRSADGCRLKAELLFRFGGVGSTALLQ